MEITILKRVLDKNQNKADEIRQLLKEKGIIMLNLISSPGAGKTSLLERTLKFFAKSMRLAIIEGDVATDHDARRLQSFGFPIVLINTEGGCHLDSNSISKVLDHLDLSQLDMIIVENVGNLVCPAAFDLGENHKIAIVSTTEGDDKPVKYPALFREASAVILNKIDLIPYTNFRRDEFYRYMNGLNANIPVFETSCTSEEGLQAWYEWMRQAIVPPGTGACII